MSTSTEPSASGLNALLAEYADLERRLADPAVHTDAAVARSLGRRYAQIGPIVR
ncbi:MAG: peptide chain release factor 1, partial [Pseudonocardiales bacterium]|nr:peptide chain release factor 1 [Pseudonocardiales bacterium]